MANIALMWNWSYSMDSELLKKLSKEIQDLKSEVMELRRRPLPLGGGTDENAIHDNVSGEIAAITEKVIPANNDLFLIEDSAASNAKRRVKLSSIRNHEATDPNAIHDNVAGEIAAITEKTSLADNDLVLIEDSAASNAKKRSKISTIANRIFASLLGLNNLTDPNADRILFWDDSAGALKWLTVSTGLSLSGTTLITSPTWSNYTPSVSGYQSMTVSLKSNSFCKYKTQGDEITIAFLLQVTTGGTASRGIFVNIPVTMNTSNPQSMTAMVYSAGTDWYPGVCFALTNGNLDIRRPGGVSWGIGTTYIALNATFLTAGV